MKRGGGAEPLDPSEKRIRAGGHGQASGESGAGLATEGAADRLVGLAEPRGGASVRLGEAREALGEDASRAVRLRAGEAADGDLEPDNPTETGQVGEPTGVSTVDATGVGTADGASGVRGGDRQMDGQVLDVEGAMIETAVRGSREEFDWEQQRDP
jgi:hypothetical protein